MSCGVGCARMMLIIFNVIFWLSGLAVLAVGIWMLVDDTITEMVDFVNVDDDDNLLEYAAYLLIGIGAFAVCVGFCGCCGALRKSKWLLGLYIFFLFIVMAGELGAGILAIVYKDDIEEDLEEKLTEEFTTEIQEGFIKKEDGKWVFLGFAQLLSVVQNELDCCGINGNGDYTGSPSVIQDHTSSWKYLPTCCAETQKDREDLQEDPDDWVNKINTYIADFDARGECGDNNIYSKGCYEEAKDWFAEKAAIIIGVGIGIACIEIFGFIFAICLCRNVEDD